ncbi:hypothetical protein FRC02_003638 [Tulasnella sp. 418]|nr:hypothetical protein FRC02_003638 [Tulasnella sp. 418]
MFGPFSVTFIIASCFAAVVSGKGGGGGSSGGGGDYSAGVGSVGGSAECFAEGNSCGGIVIGIIVAVVVLIIIAVMIKALKKDDTTTTTGNTQTTNGKPNSGTPAMATSPYIQKPVTATTHATPPTHPPVYPTSPTQAGRPTSIPANSLIPVAIIPSQPGVPMPPSMDPRNQNVIIEFYTIERLPAAQTNR